MKRRLFRMAALGIAICLFLILLPLAAHSLEPIRIHFIDAGYGDCILLKLPNSEIFLIDAGGKEYSHKLLDYLKKQNIQAIHTAIITHPHQNHFEGFFDLVKSISIGRIYTNGDKNGEEGYAELLALIQEKNIPLASVKRGDRIKTSSDDTLIKILHPAALEEGTNENSIVIQFIYQDILFLFTADIGLKGQEEIVSNFAEIRFSNVVQIPHHGGPLSETFVKTFSNPIFVISTGQNKWGIPTADDLQKLTGNILRTDQNGTIVIESDGKTLQIINDNDPAP